MEHEFPKVSVIIPCFNQGEFLDGSINSVKAQEYPDIEIVVVNDGSTDNTDDIAQSHSEIIYIVQENQGLSASRNNGFKSSTGENIIFLDSDDSLPSGAIEAGVNALYTDQGIAFAYGRMRNVDLDGKAINVRTEPESRDNHYRDLLINCYIPTPGMVIFRRKTLEDFGLFDPTVNECADYDMYLRISRTAKISAHSSIAVNRRIHPGQMTANPAGMLACALRVHARQKAFVGNDSALWSAYQNGLVAWRSYYGAQLWEKISIAFRKGRFKTAVRDLGSFVRYCSQYPLYRLLGKETFH